MRHEISQLCVTTWGAVLEFRGFHSTAVSPCGKKYVTIAHVADPNAVDSGQYISVSNIILIAKLKNKKDV